MTLSATRRQQRTPTAGDTAPDFTLSSTSGETVTLSSFRGRKNVLLAFFPLAFTSTCTAELCEFSEDFDRYAGRDVEVLPISVDSVPTLKEFKQKHAMRTDLLSDFKREATDTYGTMWQDAFFSNRAYFLIDREGVVRWAHVEATPGQKRSTAEIAEQIAKLA
ncbi:MAG: redoxin domain-containing protein [Gemmatimonadaceae bacterium]